ncbi:MAG TPA: Stp1/IreP family PP2C-type Ser/Thr phosphatase [Feifaniaceae bacterium]|nr:Stp1/IreP family PP2C-type Ser/Thr phosphatase [Feifaniaceae bacterium]
MIYAACTHIGRRLKNEDSLYVPKRPGETAAVAVADGMGGHAAGLRASTLAVEGVSSALGQIRIPADAAVRALRDILQRINYDIYRHAQTEEGCRGMGTTLTLALLYETEYIAANIGDSRLYHFDGETLTQVTRDHSLVAVLVASGSITQEEADRHPQRNIITRALGTSAYEEADFFTRQWKTGDVLLLCSDGLYGSVPHEELTRALKSGAPLEETANTLINLALDAGGTDNITAVLVRNTGGDAA